MSFVTNLTGTLVEGLFVEGYPSGADNNGGIIGTPLAGQSIGIYTANSPLSPARNTSTSLPNTPQPSGSDIRDVRGGPYNVLDGQFIVEGTGTASNSSYRAYLYVEAISVPLYGVRIRQGAWNIFSGEFDPALTSVDSGIYNIGNNIAVADLIRTFRIDKSNIYYN